MGAGKCGKYQLAGIGMAGMNLHLGAVLIDFPDVVHIGKVQFWVHPLGIEIHGKVHDIGVAGTLPVAEKGALHPLSSRQQPQLSSGCRRAAVIVGMQADNRAVTMTEMAAEIFNLIRMGVGVDNSTVLGRFTITLFSGVAPNSSSTRSQISTALSISVPEKLSGEYSYRILISFSCSHFIGELFDQLGPSTAMSMTPCISVRNTTLR